MRSVVPFRYQDTFSAVQVDVLGPVVMTAVGPRGVIGWRWKCRRCGQLLRPNTAGAQSHVAKHVADELTQAAGLPDQETK